MVLPKTHTVGPMMMMTIDDDEPARTGPDRIAAIDIYIIAGPDRIAAIDIYIIAGPDRIAAIDNYIIAGPDRIAAISISIL